jgi:hypothetical protein
LAAPQHDIKKFVLTTLALFLMGLQPVPLPPNEYRGDKTAIIQFGPVITLCGHLAGEGEIVLACASEKGQVMVVPNPCLAEGDYARLLCHELGHLNGWSGGHPSIHASDADATIRLDDSNPGVVE